MQNIDKKEAITNMLKELCLRHAPEAKSYHTIITGLRIARREQVNIVERCINKPLVIFSIQGKKHSIIGSEVFSYGEGQCTVIGVDLPSASHVKEGSPERPYLAIILELDKYLITQLGAELPPSKIDETTLKGMAQTETDGHVLDAVLRLMKLLDEPEQIEVLAPMIIKEIHYRLLRGPLGMHLKAINTLGTHSNQIADAISWLKSNFKEQLRVNDLARKVNMSVSTFHRNFTRVTSLSPLQFQKRLRLMEAQRLMLLEDLGATSAGYLVGYESHTQFNREYKRMFGEPPIKDKKKFLARA